MVAESWPLASWRVTSASRHVAEAYCPTVTANLGDGDAYALAFEEGKRAIVGQEATLKEVRDRVGTLLSAAALTIGIAVGLSSGSAGRVAALGTLGVVIPGAGFIAITIAAVRIWWPVTVVFNLDSGVLVGSYAEGSPPMTIAEMHRE